jgi:hypothetical protein
MFVQRTGRNEAFFLCHREFMHAENPSGQQGISTVPWLLYNGTVGGLTIPNYSEQCCTISYMARLFQIGLSARVECSVCLQMVPPTQARTRRSSHAFTSFI